MLRLKAFRLHIVCGRWVYVINSMWLGFSAWGSYMGGGGTASEGQGTSCSTSAQRSLLSQTTSDDHQTWKGLTDHFVISRLSLRSMDTLINIYILSIFPKVQSNFLITLTVISAPSILSTRNSLHLKSTIYENGVKNSLPWWLGRRPHESSLVFFNLFAAAEPYVSVKVTHRTPCTLIHASSDVGLLEVEAADSFP